jgi:hypothetical protein
LLLHVINAVLVQMNIRCNQLFFTKDDECTHNKPWYYSKQSTRTHLPETIHTNCSFSTCHLTYLGLSRKLTDAKCAIPKRSPPCQICRVLHPSMQTGRAIRSFVDSLTLGYDHASVRNACPPGGPFQWTRSSLDCWDISAY